MNKSHNELWGGEGGGWRLESLKGGEADWIQMGQEFNPVREVKQRSE